jgi:hypothetical protein
LISKASKRFGRSAKWFAFSNSDLDFNEDGAFGRACGFDCSESAGIAYAKNLAITQGGGKIAQIQPGANATPSHGRMDSIIEHDMNKIGGCEFGNRRRTSEMHEKCTIAIKAPYAPFGLAKCNTARDLRGMSHRSDTEEGRRSDAPARAKLIVQIASDKPRGRHDCVVMPDQWQESRESVTACPAIRRGRGLDCRSDKAGRNKHGDRRTFFSRHVKHGRQCRWRVCLILEDVGLDTGKLQQLERNLSLQPVLALIFPPRLASPSDNQNHRYGINAGMSQRHEWIDRIAEASILQVDDAGLSPREPPPGREAYRIPFICRNNIPRRGTHAGARCAEPAKDAVGNSGEEATLQSKKKVEQTFTGDHISALRTAPSCVEATTPDVPPISGRVVNRFGSNP